MLEFEAKKVEYLIISKRGEFDGMELEIEVGGVIANFLDFKFFVDVLFRKKFYYFRVKLDLVFIEDGREWICFVCSFACNFSWCSKCLKC